MTKFASSEISNGGVRPSIPDGFASRQPLELQTPGQRIRDLEEHNSALRTELNSLRACKGYNLHLLQDVMDIYCGTDTNGTFTYINPAIKKVTGWRPEDWLGRNFLSLIYPDDKATILRSFEECLKGYETPAFEIRILKKNSEYVALELKATPQFNGGQVVGVFGIASDIAWRKKAEAVVQENEERFRRIFEESPLGMVTSDSDFRFLTANEAFCEMTGYTEPELKLLTFKDITHRSNLAKDVESIKKLYKGEIPVYHTEKRYLRKNGDIVWGSAGINVIRDKDGQFLYYLAMIEDITERKRIEEALRQSEERYRLLFKRNVAGVYRAQFAGEIIDCNEAFARIYGYDTAEEALSQPLHNFYQDPEDSRRFRERLLKEKSVTNYETYGRRKDGSPVWLLENATLVPDENGEPTLIESTCFDDSKRKLAENTLAESEERYRNLFANTPIGIYRTTPDGRILVVNQTLLHMLGFSSFEQLAARNLEREGFGPQYVRADFKERIEKDGEVRGLEADWEKCDGSTIYVRENARAVRGENGTILYYEGTVEDITERKKFEQALKSSEDFSRAIIEHSPLGISVRARDGRLIGYNSSWLKIWRKTNPPEISPRDPSSNDLVFDKRDEYLEEWQEKVKDVYERGGYLLIPELKLLYQPEGDRWISQHFYAIKGKDDKVEKVVILTEDITDRKRAEETLKRLATAVEQSAEGIAITDPHGDIQYINPAFEKITGYSRDEIIGQNTRILKSGKYDKSFYREMWETLNRGKTWSGHIVNKRKDGTLYNEEMTISPVHGASGKLTNFVAIKRDVTRQVAMEQMLSHSQKMEAVGRLAGGVAHDFNNLLTAIGGYSEFLLNKLPENSPLVSDVQEIKKAGERAASLTRQLLAFSRKQIIQPKIINLNHLVSEMDKMLKRLIGEDVELINRLGPDLGFVRSDPGQIEQIIMNLSINARDAMPDGGKLIIETANLEIDGKVGHLRPGMKQGKYVMLAVHDFGTGISDAIKPHIFEPFFTTKELGKGTGLGLSTVYGIVEQNNGYIEFESQVGKGTTFKICFPECTKPFEKAGTNEAETEVIRGKETILVVEDEDMVRNLACRILRDAGYNVISAASPTDAIKISQQSNRDIHLMLTDIVMPVMNGLELARRILEINSALKVLFMSGYTDGSFLNNDIIASNPDILTKPFTKDSLLGKIRETLRKKESAIELAPDLR